MRSRIDRCWLLVLIGNSFAVGVCVLCLWMANAGVAFGFPPVVQVMGIAPTFFIFAGLGVLALAAGAAEAELLGTDLVAVNQATPSDSCNLISRSSTVAWVDRSSADMPRSVAAVEASLPGVPGDTADALFRAGYAASTTAGITDLR